MNYERPNHESWFPRFLENPLRRFGAEGIFLVCTPKEEMMHIVDVDNLPPELLTPLHKCCVELDLVLGLPLIHPDRRELAQTAAGLMMVELFEEPSTRTQISFQAAWQRLGGGLLRPENMSTKKGESEEDTLVALATYADLLVRRSADDDAGEMTAAWIDKAVASGQIRPCQFINAGSGARAHPTQFLLDSYTVLKKLGRLEGLKIVVGNDLNRGRAGRSFIRGMSRYPGNEFTLVSRDGLRMPDDLRGELRIQNVSFRETENPYPHIEEADVVYWTRRQTERLGAPELASCQPIRLGMRAISRMRSDAILMHPGPQTPEEIDPAIKDRPNFVWREQASNGELARIALLEHLVRHGLKDVWQTAPNTAATHSAIA